MGTEQRILDKLIEMSLLPEIERKTSISVKHMQVFEYLTTFTHFFVEFCRDRRLRAFSKISKILASSLFSFPCLSQILSSTPETRFTDIKEVYNVALAKIAWEQQGISTKQKKTIASPKAA